MATSADTSTAAAPATSTVADFILDRLSGWGVQRLFAYPGEGLSGFGAALARTPERFDLVRPCHEETAAFMAGAHAKFTGETGVCMTSSGAGALHLINGLYDAKMDHMPVVAIVGQTALTTLGSGGQEEVNLSSVFEDLGDYVETIATPEQARHVVDRALRIAAAERTVTAVIVPADVQMQSAPKPDGAVARSGLGHAAPHPVPDDAELQRAADLLNAGSKPAILAGAGALGATDELIAVAERLGAGIAKPLLGKAAVPDDLPYVTGSIGLLGTRASWKLMQNCDTLLMIGTTFPYSEFLPKEGQARAVQIDLSPRSVGIRYPTEVNLIGDAAEPLRRLLPLLQPKTDGAWRMDIEDDVAQWWRDLESRAMLEAKPINPQRVFWELSPRLPDGAILCGDSGSHTNWYARDVKMRRGMMGSLSGKLASMGSGLPYAIAAKMAYPDRPVVAMVGDGAMQMNGNNELVTVKHYWQQWSDPRFVVVVLVNYDLNQVTWEQRVLAGDPKYTEAQDVIDFPYSRYAELLGFKGIRVDRPDDIAPAWDEAFRQDRPVVIEFIADPDVPPLPPHITWEQTKAYLGALAKVDPDQWGIIKQSAKQMLARFNITD